MLRSIGVVIWPTLTNLSTLVLLTIVLSFRPKLSNKANTNRLPQIAFAHTKPQGDYGSHTQKLRLLPPNAHKMCEIIYCENCAKCQNSSSISRARTVHSLGFCICSLMILQFISTWFTAGEEQPSRDEESGGFFFLSDIRMWWECRRQMTHQINRLMGGVIFGEAMSNTLMD